ncbi:MAG TPA: beta-ketoacyl synthase N-terminal-like domain-containing protein, partial [Legionellaceae bacterium]|nr:beta-ketoacyl synthase N-terminal-like domain-containing protein [Legionellaceae bacterium]
ISVSEYTFDISILEHIIPLIYGASLFFFDKTQKRALYTVADKINATKKPLIQLTPTYLSLLSSMNILPNPHLIILIGGERLSQSLANYLLTLTANVWHVYGPTEACIWCTVHKLSTKDKEVYIGGPIDNTNVYVLDDELKPVGIGTRGNLYISGDCLALAYHNNQPLTQEKFFVCKNEYVHERLYDTGDLACWVEPGMLKYIGRRDRQIKFLGHRIELGEIESVLNLHPQIKHSAITVEGDSPAQLSAFYVTVDNNILPQNSLINFLYERLPDGYIPHNYHQMATLPFTRNGKIDYSKLSSTDKIQITLENSEVISDDYEEIRAKIIKLWNKLLPHTLCDLNRNFFEAGGNSFLLMQMLFDLQNIFPVKLSISDLFSKSTITELANYIWQITHPDQAKQTKTIDVKTQKDKIAVIGMALNLPGAKTLTSFWDNLCSGKESITHFSHQPKTVPSLNIQSFVSSCGLVDDIEYFDADFFEISHAHSSLMDPQQRLLLECAWSALETAAYVPENYNKRIGVVASVGSPNYFRHYVLPTLNAHPDDTITNEFTAYLMNDKDFAATRIAYHLNLTGPALTVGTACSSSLVAISEACRILNTNAADMMLAGGASLLLPHQHGYWYQPDHILSQDGHCRAFSRDATGTVPSSGVGMVILKRLSDAIQDNDHIIAVIEGSAINNDGKQKLGFTTPSYLQQMECIKSAISDADLKGDLTFIEAHGTGTKLGDAVEIKALNDAYQDIQKRPCGIGSVKSNLGHTDTASGVTSFIKAALCLYYKTIVPSLHFNTLNENIQLEHS